jgi:hypothetical protein
VERKFTATGVSTEPETLVRRYLVWSIGPLDADQHPGVLALALRARPGRVPSPERLTGLRVISSAGRGRRNLKPNTLAVSDQQ